MPDLEPIPYRAKIADAQGLLSQEYYRWLDAFRSQLGQTAQAVKTVSLPATTNAAIAPTTMLVTNSAGLFRVSWYLRITTAAGVSSSVTVTIAWTETAVPLTASGAAVTGNTTTTTQSGSLLLRSDGAAPITYATAYASNAAGAMTYRLDVLVEQVS